MAFREVLLGGAEGDCVDCAAHRAVHRHLEPVGPVRRHRELEVPVRRHFQSGGLVVAWLWRSGWWVGWGLVGLLRGGCQVEGSAADGDVRVVAEGN
ncbi:hypothetical protein GCM10010530_10370 [Kribbella aluminosa]